MSEDHRWGDTPEQPDLEGPREGEDFGDSFLGEIAREDPPFRVPRRGNRLGGEDGRRFEILAELGQGAMGRVFRARDEKLRRVVALKFLLPIPDYSEFALREARAVAQLSHEHIVKLFDISEWVGAPWEPRVPFLVMECLEGESLTALLKREKRLDVRHAMALLSDIVAGLAHAHEQQIVHRDIKPSNIFITRQGQAKLLDFGLSQSGAPLITGTPLPRAGTPAYMAPEQWRGEPQDARTDVWGVGIVLHEMLTGQLPYPEVLLRDYRERVVSSEPVPSVRALLPDIPWEVESLLRKALAKDPAWRFSSAVELRERLRDIEERLGPWRGAPLPVSPQRRQVTLVACCLAGLDGWAAQLDAEDFSELEGAFHACCAEVIQREGGSITHFVGDEVLACFGCALAREDDSEHAVAAGWRLTRSLRDTLHARLPHLPPGVLAVRVGIHTDLVTLEAGLPARPGMLPPLLGAAPRLTAWLARQAEPGTVLVSDTTWTLVRGAFQAENLGPRDFYGTLGATRLFLYRLLGEHKPAFRFDRALASGGLTPLVGRESELRELVEHWEEAVRGHGALVLLRGEAGIGKSRLIQALYEQVPPASSIRIRCQCWSQFIHTAFHPIIEQLWSVLPAATDTPAPRRQQELEHNLELFGLSRPDAQRLALLIVPPPPDETLPPVSSEQRKEKTLEALTTLLLRLARARPVLAVVEDLHWADHSTLQFLGALSERLAQARVLLLLSARPDFRPTWPQRPWTHALSLERLSAEHTALLVKELTQGRRLPAETIQELVRRTDGIPLFIEEMTRMVVERASSEGLGAASAAGSIPVTLHELLLARLDMLPRRQKALAQLCAVMGRGFTHAQLVAIAGRGEGALKQDVQGLLEAGLLQRQQESAEAGYQFRHALLQDAAYQSLPRSTRRQYHQRIADVLVEQFPEEGEARPEVLAHHYTEAGQSRQAIHYWARAGERASQRSANVEAVSHLNRALKLLRGLPESAARDEEELRLLTALGVPLALVQRYRAPQLEQLHARALRLFHQVEAAPLLELSHWGLFHYHFARAEFHQAYGLAERLVEVGTRQHNQELFVLGHRMEATLCFTWGNLTAALEHLELVLACSRFELERHRALAFKHWVDPRTLALSYAALVHSLLGERERAWAYSQEALELSERIGHPHAHAYALTHLALACIFRREYRQALEWADASIALSREHRFRLWLGWSTVIRSVALFGLGRRQEGFMLMQRNLQQWRDSGIRVGMPANLCLLAAMHLGQGRAQEALATLREGLALVELTGERHAEAELHRLHAEVLQALGQPREAVRCYLRALAVARMQRAGTYRLRATVGLGRLLQEMGLLQAARRRLARLCGRFDARRDSVDLQEARALLARLEESSPATPLR